MAVIQYTGLVTQLRGSIAGTTFSKTKQGFSAYKKGLPRKQKSAAQNAINAGFAANANLWRTLDSTARENWATLAAAIEVYNRIGELVNLSAYNMYQLVSALINPAGSGTALTCDGTTNPPYQFSTELVSLEFQTTPDGWEISDISIDVTTITNQATACQVIFWISQPELSEESASRDNWYRLAQDTIAGNVGTSHTENFTFTNLQLPPGFKIIPGYFYRIKAQMIQVNSKVFTLAVISPPTVATELPPYEFPILDWEIFNFYNDFTAAGAAFDMLQFAFDQIGNQQPMNDFNFQVRYRGLVYETPVFTPTTDNLLAGFGTNASTSTTELLVRISFTNNNDLWDEMHALGITILFTEGRPYMMLSVRLQNISNEQFSQWYDIIIPYGDW